MQQQVDELVSGFSFAVVMEIWCTGRLSLGPRNLGTKANELYVQRRLVQEDAGQLLVALR